MIITASSTPIPSSPQVVIFSSHYHSMLLLSNHTSEAKAVMHSPHSLYFIQSLITVHIDNHESLNNQFTDQSVSIESIHLSNPSFQSTIHDSIPIEITGYRISVIT